MQAGAHRRDSSRVWQWPRSRSHLARAETGEQFRWGTGTDIAPGTYARRGPSNPYFGVRQGVSSSTCSWSTHSAPEVSNENIVDTNTSMGPMSVVIPPTVAAFQTHNRKPLDDLIAGVPGTGRGPTTCRN